MYISQNIKYLRNKKSISQEEFANVFGLKRSSIGSYEEGRAVPPIVLIVKIAEYFEVGLEVLITEDISKNESANEEVVDNKQISYSNSEIAILAVRNDFFTKALLFALFEAISSWSEIIKPELKKTLLHELPRMLTDKYQELALNDQKISSDLAEKLILEIKESLNKY